MLGAMWACTCAFEKQQQMEWTQTSKHMVYSSTILYTYYNIYARMCTHIKHMRSCFDSTKCNIFVRHSKLDTLQICSYCIDFIDVVIYMFQIDLHEQWH